jgi:ABC-type transport system substrate-binding protein
MLTKITKIAVFLFAALMLALPVAAQSTPVILRYPISPDPEHLNPYTGTTIAIGTVTRNIFEGLVTRDPKTSEIKPLLADTWEISADGLTYTFHLHKGVLFHNVAGVKYDNDDREFKADDWIWSAEHATSDDDKISQHPEFTEGVVGVDDFKAGKAEHISGIRKIDDYSIEIKLTEPNRLFLIFVGGVPAVPPEAFRQLGDNFANTPVGTGPFQFIQWQRDSFLELAKNPDYWQAGKPSVDGIKYINVPDANTQLLQYRQNELDFLFSIPTGQIQAVKDEFGDQYNEEPGMNVRYFGFKMTTGFFADKPLVRQAFAHAFNRDLVWNDLMEGARYPADLGYLPPAMAASTPKTIYDYNMDKAADLLRQAGFPNGEGIPPIDLYVFSSAADELSLPVLQDDLKKLGVTLNIKVEDASTYWDHVGEDDVWFFLSGWSANSADPFEVMNYLFLDGSDDTKYDNRDVDALLRQAMKETDESKRAELYQQAHDLIVADSPWVVSAYSKVSWLQKPWISGFSPDPGGTYTARLADVTVDASKMAAS